MTFHCSKKSHAKYSLVTYHSHRIASQQGRHVQHHVIRHVGQEVDYGHYGHRDGDGQWQVPETKQPLLKIITITINSFKNQFQQFIRTKNAFIGLVFSHMLGMGKGYTVKLIFESGFYAISNMISQLSHILTLNKA